jgi:hypothetical protein
MKLQYIPVGLYLDAWIRGRAIEQAYVHQIKSDFNVVRSYLPSTAASVMDIGCGIAALDVFLFERYREQNPEMLLVDRSEVSNEIYFGFRSEAAFYNSLDRAKRTLLANGVPEHRIRLFKAPEDGQLPDVAPLDLVISILSWGFHFPIGTYLDSVCDRLAHNGRVIVDVRRKTDGLETARGSLFKAVDHIGDAQSPTSVRPHIAVTHSPQLRSTSRCFVTVEYL